jgi:hypothetical protein
VSVRTTAAQLAAYTAWAATQTFPAPA